MSHNNKICLIGKDLSLSLSYKIHKAIYDFLKINLEYKNKEFKNKLDVYSYLKDHFKDPFFAANVTYPYKETVYKFLKESNE